LSFDLFFLLLLVVPCVSLIGSDVGGYKFLFHSNLLIDSWDFYTQDSFGDYGEVKWL